MSLSTPCLISPLMCESGHSDTVVVLLPTKPHSSCKHKTMKNVFPFFTFMSSLNLIYMYSYALSMLHKLNMECWHFCSCKIIGDWLQEDNLISNLYFDVTIDFSIKCVCSDCVHGCYLSPLNVSGVTIFTLTIQTTIETMVNKGKIKQWLHSIFHML